MWDEIIYKRLCPELTLVCMYDNPAFFTLVSPTLFWISVGETSMGLGVVNPAVL